MASQYQNLNRDTFFKQLLMSPIDYPYDTSIDEYNWYLVFLGFFVFYFAAFFFFRRFAPSPGSLDDFIKRKKRNDYFFYYFQYCSLIHATVAIITGKIILLSGLDPLFMYLGGNRYN